MKHNVFAKKSSTGDIEYLEGYIKRGPAIDDGTPSSAKDCIHFGNLLATYDITLEEYIASFNKQQTYKENLEYDFVKRILNRSDIRLKSYLFSSHFVGFMNGNSYFSQRFSISEDAICFNEPSMILTTSNTC